MDDCIRWVRKEALGELQGKRHSDIDTMITYKISWEQEERYFKLAIMKKRKSNNSNHLRSIKSDDKKVLVKGIDIKKRWREYINKLLNEDSIESLRTRKDTLLIGHTFYCKIRVEKMKKSMTRMKIRKTTGPDGIPIES